MKKIIVIIAMMAMAFGCQQNNSTATLAPGVHKGIALEKINTSQYTYLLINENGVETWLAFPLAEVKIGETYFYANEMLMTNFESKELKRIFEKVYFVSGVTTKSPLPTSAAKQGNSVTVPEKINTKIAPAPNGLTVADLFEKKESLAGKKVLVKGKVVKFSAEIMGRNWIHIQDGTFYKGSFDLTITSQQTVNIGDIITLEGILVLNKDFGSGYKYDVLIENAIVK